MGFVDEGSVENLSFDMSHKLTRGEAQFLSCFLTNGGRLKMLLCSTFQSRLWRNASNQSDQAAFIP